MCLIVVTGPTVVGAKGQKGLAGYPGDNGTPGTPGKPGFDGSPGLKGANGDTGYYGLTGSVLLCCYTALYSRDHGDLVLFGQEYHPKTSFRISSWHLEKVPKSAFSMILNASTRLCTLS